MRQKTYLSINHICLFLGLVLGMAAMGSSILVLWITRNVTAALCVLGFGVFAFGCGVFFVWSIRKKTGLVFRPALRTAGRDDVRERGTAGRETAGRRAVL